MGQMGTKGVVCEVESVLQLIRGRWRVLILRELEGGPRRHSELLRSLDGISQKVLTESLRCMERQGLVSRAETSGTQIKVEYALTHSGTDLMTIVMAMHKWARKHRSLMNRVAQDLQRHRARRSSLTSVPGSHGAGAGAI